MPWKRLGNTPLDHCRADTGWRPVLPADISTMKRSEEHTSELQSHLNLVCRLLLEKKKKILPAPRHRQLWPLELRRRARFPPPRLLHRPCPPRRRPLHLPRPSTDRLSLTPPAQTHS